MSLLRKTSFLLWCGVWLLMMADGANRRTFLTRGRRARTGTRGSNSSRAVRRHRAILEPGRDEPARGSLFHGHARRDDFLAYARSPRNGSGDPGRSPVRSYGFYLYYLGGGGIKITDLDLSGRPYVVREESHGDWLISAAAASKIGSRVDIGVSAKIIYRDLGVESGYGLSMDAGALYQAHRCVRLGLMVTDITTGFIRYSDGTESIYPTVKPGIMLQYSHSDFTGRAMASGDIKFENIKVGAQYWSGPLSLDTHFGWELDWRGMLFGRAGFDIGRFTTGVGFILSQISFDFAYLHHDAFDETYRVSAGYQF